MSSRCAQVLKICMESLEIEVDFPVVLGEFVQSKDGWWGVAESHTDRIVRVTPLTSPEKIKAGDILEFTGETLTSRLVAVRAGTVVDPLGRFIMPVTVEDDEKSGILSANYLNSEDAHHAKKPGSAVSGTLNSDVKDGQERSVTAVRDRGSLRGLKNLGTFMSLREGEGFAVLGAPPGGLPALFAQFALSSCADYLFIYCQGGYRELYRYIRAVRLSGRAGETIILWTPPWDLPEMKNLASRSFARIVSSNRRKGRGLVLIDDLHYWLESLRERGEISNEIFLPDGYPYTARRQLAEFLDLKTPPDGKGNSLSIVVGWRYEAGDAATDQSYLARLSQFMRTGIILEERAEYLYPSDSSWGELSPVGRAWHELRARCEDCDEEIHPAMSTLTEIFASLFVEYSPLDLLRGAEERVPFTRDDEENLYHFASSLRDEDEAELLLLRTRIRESFTQHNPDDPQPMTISEGKKIFLARLTKSANGREVRG